MEHELGILETFARTQFIIIFHELNHGKKQPGKNKTEAPVMLTIFFFFFKAMSTILLYLTFMERLLKMENLCFFHKLIIKIIHSISILKIK